MDTEDINNKYLKLSFSAMENKSPAQDMTPPSGFGIFMSIMSFKKKSSSILGSILTLPLKKWIRIPWLLEEIHAS